MSCPKARLDPEVVSASRQTTLRRYADRNKVKLRTKAQTRMQRLCSKPATQAQTEGKRAAEKRYRVQNRDMIHAADALRRAKKYIELRAAEAHEELFLRPVMAKMQRKHKGHALPPRPQPTIVLNSSRCKMVLEEWSEPESSDEEDFSPIPDTVFYRRSIPRLRSNTPPDLHCDCLLPAYCDKCTCGCDNNCCLYRHSNKSEECWWMKDLTREEEMLRVRGLRPT
ncbi:hypothetical protein B0H17DRAFT_1192368 [Mycena rosella]|uniref:Uncharacterized protein n=1 Tax=Mycena rosella TaxID=1033263 RepID=A0AAD7GWK7_MYCRO|nr:hypothetical protein B0H17DRAFT_1192368 [Mycena rosella]